MRRVDQMFRQLFKTLEIRQQAILCLALLSLTSVSAAQQKISTQSKLDITDEYAIDQSIDMGGHVADYSGSDAMYSTLVNIQSGPRALDQTLNMQIKPGIKGMWVDSLLATSSGYGGDPNNIVTLQAEKGKWYSLQVLFRRDRQYFDYDLLDNPLVPSGLSSNGYTFPQVLHSPHLFNDVRRMGDYDLTFFPLARVSFRVDYSHNISEGPSYSSIHMGTEGLLLQNWRNTTDNWNGSVAWKPTRKTQIAYAEYFTHYKSDTNWQLAGLNLQLANGTPVSLGFDNVTVPSNSSASTPCGAEPPILDGSTNPATANPCENGYLQYTRSAPTRVFIPTEEFRFETSDIPKVAMNGRIRYTDANSSLPDYFEYFNGLESRSNLRASTTSGFANAKRINVSADFGIVYQMTGRFSLSDQYDYWNFGQPGSDYLSAVDQSGSSMLQPPGAAGAATVTQDHYFLGQKTETNLATASYDAASWATISLGYRYRARVIHLYNPDADFQTIHQNGGILSIVLHPKPTWLIDGKIEALFADHSYVQLDPRQMERYSVRTQYHPKEWAALSAMFSDLEQRDNVIYVNHLDHTRTFSLGADLNLKEYFGISMNYGYIDVFTQTDECYTATPALPDATKTTSPACIANGTPYFSNGYYDAPTQYGSIGLSITPVRKLTTRLGYRMNSVNGTTTEINARQVPGSLQSQYESPYAEVAYAANSAWTFSSNWNYYEYSEGSSIGPTATRNFRGNVFTIDMHHKF